MDRASLDSTAVVFPAERFAMNWDASGFRYYCWRRATAEVYESWPLTNTTDPLFTLPFVPQGVHRVTGPEIDRPLVFATYRTVDSAAHVTIWRWDPRSGDMWTVAAAYFSPGSGDFSPDGTSLALPIGQSLYVIAMK